MKPSSCVSSNRTCVPIHSSGPSTTSQSTSSAGSGLQDLHVEAAGHEAEPEDSADVAVAVVSSVHQPASPSTVVSAA